MFTCSALYHDDSTIVIIAPWHPRFLADVIRRTPREFITIEGLEASERAKGAELTIKVFGCSYASRAENRFRFYFPFGDVKGTEAYWRSQGISMPRGES